MFSKNNNNKNYFRTPIISGNRSIQRFCSPIQHTCHTRLVTIAVGGRRDARGRRRCFDRRAQTVAVWSRHRRFVAAVVVGGSAGERVGEAVVARRRDEVGAGTREHTG